MKLIVGLGNPGVRYETTRHNAGFLAVDRLIDRWNAQGPEKKSGGEVYTASVAGEKVLIIKPQTFMNLSGKCVGPIAGFYKLKPSDIIVLYDELDLKPFAIRIKTGGGTGGHNGLKSLDEHLGAGNQGYHRVRLGIGRPLKGVDPIDPGDYVLQQFSDSELERMDPFLDRVAEAVERMLKGDISGAMTEFNRPSPEEEKEK